MQHVYAYIYIDMSTHPLKQLTLTADARPCASSRHVWRHHDLQIDVPKVRQNEPEFVVTVPQHLGSHPVVPDPNISGT